MKKISFSSYVGYAVSIVTFLCGICIVGGLFKLNHIPSQLRYIFGFVFILWGVYRYVVTYTNEKQRQSEQDEE